LKELAWLLPFDEKVARGQAARGGTKAADDARATRAKRSSILSVIVPADGTSAASRGNGDFGTSPIFGQLSDKPLLACN
jgi:hypothetical protein